ncbi:MAG: acyl-CoA reductase [Weeksellaceae bacterium]
MQISQRIIAFSNLGNNLESFINNFDKDSQDINQQEFNQVLQQAKAKNGWFTIENQLYALASWAQGLTRENIENWLAAYNIPHDITPQSIGIVTAGNIPMVGFHDILCVLMSGHKALIKPSSNDEVLIRYVLKQLTNIEPNFKEQIAFVEQLKGYDAVIATGSDNTARYFETYFDKVPHIIRKNRTSIAVIEGNETEDELKNLAEDILRHFGLGCRNVTKLMIPKGYDMDKIFKALYPWADIINHHKYANNYDYHKAIYLMKGLDFVENGFVIVKKDDSLFSPISTIYYQEYENDREVKSFIQTHDSQIQCVVGKKDNMIPFGKAQQPDLWDYADNIDTMKWLLNLK